MNTPTTLPANLRKNGFDYALVLLGIRSCIYRQYVTPGIEYYEVFLIQIKPEWNINGKIIPAHEASPGNEDFGKSAWVYRSYEKALQKLKELGNDDIQEGGHL